MGVVRFMCGYRWVAGAQGSRAAHRGKELSRQSRTVSKNLSVVSKVVCECAAFSCDVPTEAL